MNTTLESLSPSRQRTLAVALAIAVVAAAASLVVVPVVMLHQRYDDAIATLDDKLVRYRNVAAQAPAYRKALDTMRTKDARRFFLKNSAVNLAGAELQELVRAAIEASGGRITTSQNLAAKDDGRFKQIGVSFQFFATTPNLQKALAAMETQVPYVVVDNVTLRPLNAFRGFRPAPGQEPELNVQLEASAYAYPEASRK